jgi:protein-serine/threonine kinase
MSKNGKLQGATQAGIASAQARVSGDQETQSMLELLARANLSASDYGNTNGLGFQVGPLTCPPQFHGDNVFEQNYMAARSESPDDMEVLSPTTSRKSVHLEHSDSSLALHAMSMSSKAHSIAEVPEDVENSKRASGQNNENSKKPVSPDPPRPGLSRTYTDTSSLRLQNTLIDAMVQPYPVNERLNSSMLSPPLPSSAFPAPLQSPTFPTPADSISPSQLPSYGTSHGMNGVNMVNPVVHGHSSRWAPAAQAIFTTEAKAPWTILAANDLACLVFGVTNAEVRKMGILEVVQEERRAWLKEKLAQPGSEADHKNRQAASENQHSSPRSTTSFLLGRGGITASLLSKPPARQTPRPQRRTQTDDGAGSSIDARKKAVKGGLNHQSNKSRGVLLCGDVVPIQKRNGHTGSASLWVKEKKGGLIWVLEEIHEDVASISVDNDGKVTKFTGAAAAIWGEDEAKEGVDIGCLIPRIPRQGIDPRTGPIDYAETQKKHYFGARHHKDAHIPTAIDRVPGSTDLRVSSFPHIAGIIVLAADTLQIINANSVFSAALFGQERPDGLYITDLIPGFDRILRILTDDNGIRLEDGIVVPEHSFRRARGFAALRDGKADAAAYFLRPDGLPAKHRDGSEIKIDVQMRVVKSDKQVPHEHVIVEEDDASIENMTPPQTEVVYALWITYSRHLHAGNKHPGVSTPILSGESTPLHQPSPGQTQVSSPLELDSDEPKKEMSHASLLTKQLKDAALKTASKIVGRDVTAASRVPKFAPTIIEPPVKKTINDFVILEEMGQGAYGQVKLARNKNTGAKVVLKFVTKRRILVDTWTRDRRLGTVPLEIHVLDYLRRNDLQHPNIVEMEDFFEDEINYYIEMVPHGLPGMDLFDYIELRVNMDEAEARRIFLQVVKAVHHLHTKAQVVHRDIKDENVVLDGEGVIKLIDFGSAAYIKNGPFDVFVGTIGQPPFPYPHLHPNPFEPNLSLHTADYAAPEVLAGKAYRGKEQDVWALGILLYTIIYKENPFYSIDEIMDRDLRVPYILSEASIDLIRLMLNRDVESRIEIEGVLNHVWLQEGQDEELESDGE